MEMWVDNNNSMFNLLILLFVLIFQKITCYLLLDLKPNRVRFNSDTRDNRSRSHGSRPLSGGPRCNPVHSSASASYSPSRGISGDGREINVDIADDAEPKFTNSKVSDHQNTSIAVGYIRNKNLYVNSL